MKKYFLDEQKRQTTKKLYQLNTLNIIFLGGLHRFHIGHNNLLSFLYLLTCGFGGFGAVLDLRCMPNLAKKKIQPTQEHNTAIPKVWQGCMLEFSARSTIQSQVKNIETCVLSIDFEKQRTKRILRQVDNKILSLIEGTAGFFTSALITILGSSIKAMLTGDFDWSMGFSIDSFQDIQYIAECTKSGVEGWSTSTLSRQQKVNYLVLAIKNLEELKKSYCQLIDLGRKAQMSDTFLNEIKNKEKQYMAFCQKILGRNQNIRDFITIACFILLAFVYIKIIFFSLFYFWILFFVALPVASLLCVYLDHNAKITLSKMQEENEIVVIWKKIYEIQKTLTQMQFISVIKKFENDLNLK
ncbi:hypothetical protein VB712_17440 [Spirulina sp. CCNP1310]|uniref:hypothetical protein n=1 Tax=Spirulina sp. CCNP1310 TaxID=3110249 RepID=UPI002B205DFE|nr:hypothetical protein [Spirulina sp. CCNP1310]MEA5421012.1 hypothetical protein [Spirulina sp. CCNP1310]